jgi:hypothetical protein
MDRPVISETHSKIGHDRIPRRSTHYKLNPMLHLLIQFTAMCHSQHGTLSYWPREQFCGMVSFLSSRDHLHRALSCPQMTRSRRIALFGHLDTSLPLHEWRDSVLKQATTTSSNTPTSTFSSAVGRYSAFSWPSDCRPIGNFHPSFTTKMRACRALNKGTSSLFCSALSTIGLLWSTFHFPVHPRVCLFSWLTKL